MASITREEIEKLEAGEDANEIIAREIFGLDTFRAEGGEYMARMDFAAKGDWLYRLNPPPGEVSIVGWPYAYVKDYTRSNAAAIELSHYISPFYFDSRFGCIEISTEKFTVKEKTASLAFCKTALLIKMFGAK